MPSPTITMPAREMLAMLEALLLFASRDKTRPHLSGIYLDVAEDGAHAVATDGHRMAVYRLPPQGGGTGVSLIPQMDAARLRDALRGIKKASKHEFAGASATLEDGRLTVGGRIVGAYDESSERYPAWREVMPSGPGGAGHDAYADADYLADACAALSIVATACVGKGSVVVRILYGATPLDPLRLESPVAPQLTCVVMPMRY